MARILITGGTGLIGTALTEALIQKGHEVIILTRNANKHDRPGIVYKQWDINNQFIDPDAIRQTSHIVHLAGANVADGRWTKKRKKEIIDSREKSGQLLVASINKIPNNIQAVISSSAIGYYGPDAIDSRKAFVETDPPVNDFLGTVVQKWEAAVSSVTEIGKRLIIFRTGIVLSPKGGAFPELTRTLKFGVASILGTGKQMISWIHIDDLVRLYIAAIEDDSWQGVYNAVAPGPVSNEELIKQAARQKNFYVPIHVPEFVLKSLLGEMSVEVLKSATVSPAKVERKGFFFLYPSIASVLRKSKDV